MEEAFYQGIGARQPGDSNNRRFALSSSDLIDLFPLVEILNS
jgi:hypothetical protein